MEANGQSDHGFRPEIFEKTYHEIASLNSRLPEDAVASLAREVLLRVASRVVEVKNRVLTPSSNQIETLAFALISKNEKAGADLILAATAAGMDIETVYLQYLAGAARLLGELWDNDRVSFAEVTIGTSRMYSIMRASNHLLFPQKKISHKSAIFASTPSETHTLGVRMAADIFRRDGWDIHLMLGQSHDALVEDIAQSPHFLIGLSSAGRHSSAELARLIIALRISKPTAYIMVSGQIVNDAKDIISLLGADGIAHDFESARTTLEGLWDRLEAAEGL